MSTTARYLMQGIVLCFLAAALLSSNADAGVGGNVTGAAAALSLAGLLLAWWFVHGFVINPLPTLGDGRETALGDVFGFAYVFTGAALLALAFPFGGLLSHGSLPQSGPIRLLQACVRPDRPAPAVNDQTSSAQTMASSTTTVPASGAASTSTAASGAERSRLPSPAQAPASASGYPVGLPRCSEDMADAHSVLISIGGVVARRVEPEGAAPFASAATAALPASAVPAASSRRPNAVPTPSSGVVYEVESGFVVPLFMAVLALLGGIINLMRRLPEYQKRTHLDFVGTDKEKPLQPYEAREFVVFQVLQLVAAPFVAMVAFYAVAPTSMASAAALAFVSGFFSEGLLLRIRGLVEGPDKTPTEAASKPSASL